MQQFVQKTAVLLAVKNVRSELDERFREYGMAYCACSDLYRYPSIGVLHVENELLPCSTKWIRTLHECLQSTEHLHDGQLWLIMSTHITAYEL